MFQTLNTLNNTERKNVCEYKLSYSNSKDVSFLILLLPLIGFNVIQTPKLYYPYMYESVGYIISNVVIIFAILLYVLLDQKIIWREKSAFFYIAMFIVYTIISANISNGGYRYAGIIINTLLLSLAVGFCRVSINMIKAYLLFISFDTIWCLSRANSYFQMQYLNETINSNILAFFGLSVLVYGHWSLSWINSNKTFISIMKIFFSLSSFYIIWECESRGTISAWLFFMILYYCVPVKMLKNQKIIIIMSVSIFIMGIVFPYIYIKHIRSFQINIMGKTANTRARIWGFFWKTIENSGANGIIGFGTKNEMRKIFDYGAHNVYLCMWYEIGFIGLILFCAYICVRIYKIYSSEPVYSHQIIALVGFMSFLIYDYFGDELTGPLVVWSYIMLGLARQTSLVKGKLRIHYGNH